MKRLTSASGTRLIFLALGMGCLAVLALMLWAGHPASASRLDSVAQVGVAAPPGGVLASQYVPGISCTLAITTTSKTLPIKMPAPPSQTQQRFPPCPPIRYQLALSFGDVPRVLSKVPGI